MSPLFRTFGAIFCSSLIVLCTMFASAAADRLHEGGSGAEFVDDFNGGPLPERIVVEPGFVRE